ncbi:MAG: hypothetical protein WC621_01030 [Patescibacteria group bacterium]
MNKYTVASIIVLLILAGYGWQRLISYRPVDDITQAKLNLGNNMAAVKEPPAIGAPLPAVPNDLEQAKQLLVGFWQSSDDLKTVLNYQIDNTVIEYTSSKPTSTGTWKVAISSDKKTGQQALVLSLTKQDKTDNYLIVNLSKTNLVYIQSGQGGMHSFNKIP